ncbi:MAG: TlpA disulfide reductase family protein [Nibricoccus sp.]
MKNIRLGVFCVCFSLLATVVSIRADGEKPAAAAPASTVDSQVGPIVEKIKNKVQAGARSEAALSDELKALDAVVASHKGEQSEDLAQVLMLKAAIYLQVIQDLDKGEAVLKQVKTDFPNSEPAKHMDELLSGIAAQKKAQQIQAALKPGAAFPDFEVKDIAGKPLSIAKYKGKVVLVDFWATWCGPCVEELPNVVAAYEKFHGKGFEIIGVSLDEDEARLKAFIAEKKMTWAHYFDGKGWQSELGQKYGITGIPATFLLDRAGKIIAKDLRGEELAAMLEKELGK